MGDVERRIADEALLRSTVDGKLNLKTLKNNLMGAARDAAQTNKLYQPNDAPLAEETSSNQALINQYYSDYFTATCQILGIIPRKDWPKELGNPSKFQPTHGLVVRKSPDKFDINKSFEDQGFEIELLSTPKGYKNPKNLAELKDFQTDHGLKVTGIRNSKTEFSIQVDQLKMVVEELQSNVLNAKQKSSIIKEIQDVSGSINLVKDFRLPDSTIQDLNNVIGTLSKLNLKNDPVLNKELGELKSIVNSTQETKSEVRKK